jgi:chemotaxis protein MotB
MIRRLYIGIAILAVVFVASGCVSSGTFKKMETAKNDEIATLQKNKTDLEKQKSDLEKQQIDSLAKQNASMQKEVGSLSQEKAALVAANQQRQQQYESLLQGLSKEVEKGQLQVRQYKNMLAVDLAEQIFFDSGKATLKKGGKEVLKKVGDALKGYENKVIRVVGHTDNVPVAKSLQATFPTNWELSVARATNVVRYLQEVGIPPERMIPAGRGEYDPVAPNDTPEGRQKNRRIEIMLLDKALVSEMTRTAN